VRVDGRIVWREGAESMSAGDSYDAAAELMQRRRAEYHAKRTARRAVRGGAHPSDPNTLSEAAVREVEAILDNEARLRLRRKLEAL
jgi:hypothetical protein